MLSFTKLILLSHIDRFINICCDRGIEACGKIPKLCGSARVPMNVVYAWNYL